MCPQAKLQMIKGTGSCISVDWASVSYLLFIESLVQVLPKNVEKIRCCPVLHDPCVVADEEARVSRVPVNHSPKI
jgi:hypothetical protein